MTNFENLFGDKESALRTLASIACVNMDTFDTCEGCVFYHVGVDCPAYNHRLNNEVDPKDLTMSEWFDKECA